MLILNAVRNFVPAHEQYVVQTLDSGHRSRDCRIMAGDWDVAQVARNAVRSFVERVVAVLTLTQFDLEGKVSTHRFMHGAGLRWMIRWWAHWAQAA
jgi:hypothetical protein